jgi:hemerythrin-like domain-containing protein
MDSRNDRRAFLIGATALGVAAVTPNGTLSIAADEAKEKHDEAAISAPEDLMREHGLLNRILLIYEEGVRRMRNREEVAAEVFQKPAELVRKFVEEYHEQLEEKFIFPKFEKKKRLVELVTTLRQQHQAGRVLTDRIIRAAPEMRFGSPALNEVGRACEAFIRMYRPHEAREDTVLFPALYEIISAKEVAELGEQFEEEEHRRFGKEGFEENVEKVAAIEKQLGVYDLNKFTPM